MKIKHILCSVALLFTTCAYAANPEWFIQHQAAVKLIKKDNQKAHQHLCKAIESLKDPKDPATLFLFLERGSMSLEVGVLEESILDFDHIISCFMQKDKTIVESAASLGRDDKMLLSQALYEKKRYYLYLPQSRENMEMSKQAYEDFRAIYPRGCEHEEMEDGMVIVKFFPKNRFERMKSLLLETGIVKREEDISLSPIGILTYKEVRCESEESCCGSCADAGECQKEQGVEEDDEKKCSKGLDVTSLINCRDTCRALAEYCIVASKLFESIDGEDPECLINRNESICLRCCDGASKETMSACFKKLFEIIDKMNGNNGRGGSGGSRYGTSFRSDSPENPHRDTFRRREESE